MFSGGLPAALLPSSRARQFRIAREVNVATVAHESEAERAHALFSAAFYARAGQRFALRLAEPGDRAFLRGLFSAVSAEATQRAGGDPSWLSMGPLLAIQFESQAQAYAAAHPSAHHYLARRSGEERPIGRILIDWTRQEEAVVGIDLAVLPDAREGALGLHLLRAWVATCDELRRPARLHVMPDNPARRIYRRLGFVETASQLVPIPMQRAARGALLRSVDVTPKS